MKPYKPRAWMFINWEVSFKLRRGDFVRYGGKWLEIYRITEDSGIQLSNFTYACLTKLDDYK